MQTQLADFIKHTPQGEEAEAILRRCVHCGFCTAACPTYRLLGDERDSPRGRIYLIKQALEGEPVTAATQLHLDRCLTCRSCETACPSGVQYGRLLDIGRQVVESKVNRPWLDAAFRRLLRWLLPYPRRFGPLLKLAQSLRPLLPAWLKAKLPPPGQAATPWPPTRHARRVILLQGCVQPALAPNINPATARVLDKLGIGAVVAPQAGCCGALSQHLSAPDAALDFVRRNIDAWWPLLEQGAEAVVINASGCGAMVKEYGHLLCHEPAYADKAARVSAVAKDIAELLAAENLAGLAITPRRIAFHCPCTLQHGQQLGGVTEGLLRRLGLELTPVADTQLCCGSAGSYSLLQPELSRRLLEQKAANLAAGQPELIATANIGCLSHLQSGTALPVCHWVELLD